VPHIARKKQFRAQLHKVAEKSEPSFFVDSAILLSMGHNGLLSFGGAIIAITPQIIEKDVVHKSCILLSE
jgi:hypothetical protein